MVKSCDCNAAVLVDRPRSDRAVWDEIYRWIVGEDWLGRVLAKEQ
jgi:hypothetical protein